MDRRVEFMGAPINIPDMLSGIQTYVENYFGHIIQSLVSQGGIIRPLSEYSAGTPPCKLYVTGGDLMIKPGQILFPNEPFPLVEVADEEVYATVSTLIDDAVNHTFYVYANYTQVTSGIFKQRAAGFVYNDDLPATYYNELLDDITFTVETSAGESSEQKILIGTLYNDWTEEQALAAGYTYYSGLTINQLDGALFAEHGLMGKFADRYITLNTIITDLMGGSLTAGMRVMTAADTSVDMVVTPSGTGHHWVSNVPISAAAPQADTDLTTMEWVTTYIAEVLYAVPDVLNFRMTDVAAIGPKRGGVEETEKDLQSFAAPGFTPRRLRAYFEWGYDNIIGTGTKDTSYFDVTTSGVSFNDDDLIDYYFWIPQLQTTFSIYDNSGNRLYLQYQDGTAFTFTDDLVISVPDDPATNAWIHMNAKSYEMSALSQTSGAEEDPVTYKQHYSAAANNSTILKGQLDVDAGVKYAISLRGARGNVNGNWINLSSGTFDKYYPKANSWITDISYVSPWIAKHPLIPFNSVAATPMVLNGTLNGFSVTLDTDLWPDAEMYEIVYSTSASPTFGSTSQEKKIFSGSYTEVVVNSPGTYYIKLRPLIAGLQVCADEDIISDSVLAASTGSQYGELITEFPVSLTTFKTTIEWSSASMLWDITAMESPAVSGVINVHGVEQDGIPVGNVQYPDIDNKIGYIDTVDYRIDQYDGDSIELTTMDFNTYIGTYDGEVKTMYVSVSEIGRRLGDLQEYMYDINIKKIEVTVGVLRHYPVNIRVYQLGYDENGFDNLTLSQGNTTYHGIMDVNIIGSRGNRTIVTDAFDDGYPVLDDHNAGGFSGYIKIFGFYLLPTAQ